MGRIREMEDCKMADLIDDLLKTYYGFGDENETAKSFLSQDGLIDRQNIFEKTVSTNYIVDDTEENLMSEESNAQVNDSAADQAGNDSEEIIIRPSRAIIDDDDTNEENVWENDRELILDSKEIRKDIVSDDTKTGINLITTSDKEGTRDEPATSQASLGILEVLVQDNVSEISSSLAPKKKLKKKSRTTASAPNVSTQLPPVRFQPPVRKTPTYNEEFFDMSDAFITEFPINLLDDIQGIKMLYLENNALTNLPGELFTNLKFLKWLDVRHNKLTMLPTTIKHHPSLETILLQGNQFERLPLELGMIPNLKGLQIQDNPLVYPPSNILSLGFTGIINFLRKQWNADHPDEIVNPPQEVKSELTILCHDPPSVQTTSRTIKMHTNSSSIVLPKLHKNNPSIREKSWNYKPSNRCNGSGMNAILEAKLQWISKVKEKLNKQAAILQRIKDRDALKNWRQDRRSFAKSIKKAANRTSEDIPFGVDYTDIAFLSKQQLQKEKQINSPKKDVNTKMSEISMSLAQLQTEKQSGKLDTATELKRLQVEIEKLSNLQRQIHDLKNLNQTSMSKYNDVDTGKLKIKYKPPPSIII